MHFWPPSSLLHFVSWSYYTATGRNRTCQNFCPGWVGVRGKIWKIQSILTQLSAHNYSNKILMISVQYNWKCSVRAFPAKFQITGYGPFLSRSTTSCWVLSLLTNVMTVSCWEVGKQWSAHRIWLKKQKQCN